MDAKAGAHSESPIIPSASRSLNCLENSFTGLEQIFGGAKRQ
jgi:hypothetical protein